MSVKYEVREVAGHGLSLGDPSFRGGATVEFCVFNGDRKVWSGNCYFTDHLTGRQKNGLRLQASKACKRYQEHYDRTGKCWEAEQDEKDGEKFFAEELNIVRKEAQRELAAEVFDRKRAGTDPFAGIAPRIHSLAAEILQRRNKNHVTRYKRIDAYSASSGRRLIDEIVAWFNF